MKKKQTYAYSDKLSSDRPQATFEKTVERFKTISIVEHIAQVKNMIGRCATCGCADLWKCHLINMGQQ